MLIWSGSTAFGLADLWTASVTRGGSETGSLYRGLERLFSISTLAPQVQIPVNELPALPTYADSLVT
jgi:hypothetical protein